MRLRAIVGLVGMFTFAGSTLTASSATAYQVMEPPATAISITNTDIVVAGTATEPCAPAAVSLVAGPLPKLAPGLLEGLARYGRNPSGGNTDEWIDSGGPFGGGVPASAVRTLMRRGLAAGLTDEQVQSFLQPGFLRGMNDPMGGAWLFDFIGEQNDPAFLGQLASYAQALGGRYVSPMSAQADVFEALPLLRAAYMAQAGAIPPDLVTAGQMLSLANQGYGPAERTVQAFLVAGSHPSAGAQNAGGVADGMRATVYDYFVANYTGPLSGAAAAALANRGAYNAWVARIATWVGDGAVMQEVPHPAEFPAPVSSTPTTPGVTETSVSAC
jgi:hypothetical protein